MKTLHSVLLLVLGVTFAQANPDSRALWQVRDMIICVVPDNWPVLDFSDCGCYCGLGGSGTPVDELDRCCEVHDTCYSNAMKLDECGPLLDNLERSSKRFENEIKYWHPSTSSRSFLGNNDKCEMFICECDRQTAECFARSEYNEDHNHLPSDRCQWTLEDLRQKLSKSSEFSI